MMHVLIIHIIGVIELIKIIIFLPNHLSNDDNDTRQIMQQRRL